MQIRVTELDQVRYYRASDMTAEELQERLRHRSPPNRKMLAGTAWHAVLENPPGDEIGTVEQDGFTFQVECDVTLALPHVREIRAEKTFFVDGEAVELSGGCDGITGVYVGDHKLTERPNPENYTTAYQWRAYLELFDADAFDYWLWHAKYEDDCIRVRDLHTFRVYRYPQMRIDLIDGIRDFLEFARVWLPERFEDPSLPGTDSLVQGIQPEDAA